MAKSSQKEKIAELEQELQLRREREHRVQLYLTRIISFNPVSLPPTSPGKTPRLATGMQKQKELAVKALLILEPDRRLAQGTLEKYGVADGSDPEG